MSDDMASKLQQIRDMLNNDEMKDKLKSVMSIMPNLQNTDSNPNSENQHHQSGNFGLSENEVMLSKFMKIMDKRNKLNDPRINLLSAMRPYLSQRRQGRIDSYSKILSFTQIASIFNDEDL